MFVPDLFPLVLDSAESAYFSADAVNATEFQDMQCIALL